MKCIHINIRGLRTNLASLLYLIEQESPDYLQVQETKTHVPLRIPGYYTAHTIPSKGIHFQSMGTQIFVKEGLTYNICQPRGIQNDDLELVTTEIVDQNNRKLTITSLYRNPRQANNLADQELSALLNSPKSNLIMGDLNARFQHPCNLFQNTTGKVLDKMADEDKLVILSPPSPTHYSDSGNTSSTIDIGITHPDNIALFNTPTVGASVGSDHVPLIFTTNSAALTSRRNHVPRPLFRKANWEGYQESLRSATTSFPDIGNTKDSVDAATQAITDAILEADAQNIPKSKPSNFKHPHLPQHIVEIIKIKRNLHQRWQRNRDRTIKTQINQLTKVIKELLQNWRSELLDRKWDNLAQDAEQGKTSYWKAAKTCLKIPPPKSNLALNLNGRTLVSDEEKATGFREIYEEIYSPAPAIIPDTEHEAAVDHTWNIISENQFKYKDEDYIEFPCTVSAEDVRRSLKGTKNTAPGQDGIHYTHLKHLPIVTTRYLAKIYETCLKLKYFPDLWKAGLVALLPKPNKDLRDPKNFRPITLLAALGKVMERIVSTRLKHHIEENNLLPYCQSGFRSHRSTQDQLLKLIQHATQGFQTGKTTILTCFDIEKAYDKIHHQNFIYKLSSIVGLSDDLVAFLLNYLSNRTVVFKVNNARSQPLTLRAGTPQGAILSPTLFNLWVSDIPLPKSGTHLSQFADDIATYSSHRNPGEARDRLQIFNQAITHWCAKWRIILATNKTQIIGLAKKKIHDTHTISQTINGTRVEGSNEATLLGITLDNKLTLQKHFKKQLSKLDAAVRHFSTITGTSIRPRSSQSLNLNILRSCITSLCSYAPTITLLWKDSWFEQIDRKLRVAGRKAIHAPRGTPNEYIYRETNLPHSFKELIHTRAKNYIRNERRPRDFIEWLDKQKYRLPRGKISRTPLGVLEITELGLG